MSPVCPPTPVLAVCFCSGDLAMTTQDVGSICGIRQIAVSQGKVAEGQHREDKVGRAQRPAAALCGLGATLAWVHGLHLSRLRPPSPHLLQTGMGVQADPFHPFTDGTSSAGACMRAWSVCDCHQGDPGCQPRLARSHLHPRWPRASRVSATLLASWEGG